LIALAVYHDGQRSRFGPLLDKVAHPRHRPVVSDPPHEFEGGGYWNVPLAPLRVDHGRASGTSPLRLSYTFGKGVNLDRFGTKKQRHTGQRHMYLVKASYMMAYVP